MKHPDVMLELGFEARVRSRVGLSDGPRFRTALFEAVTALGGVSGLPWAALFDVLPRRLFDRMTEEHGSVTELSDIYRNVAARSGLSLGLAISIVEACTAVLAEQLDEPARTELLDALASGSRHALAHAGASGETAAHEMEPSPSE